MPLLPGLVKSYFIAALIRHIIMLSMILVWFLMRLISALLDKYFLNVGYEVVIP